ncbi:rcc01693 family protein [Rhizobium puerariae]|uniref:Rcc01693 family protein n=1 Tax=Rhizobium puerariae TaxID=1585791 RepID=A0ABV6ALC1_9HYPH
MKAAAGRQAVPEQAPGGFSSGIAAGEKTVRAEPFPWEAAMHAGFCLLRLPPRDFWMLTPVEFLAMTGGLRPRGGAMERAGLEALMKAFPDGA